MAATPHDVPQKVRSQVTLKTAFTVCFAVAASVALAGFLYITRYAIALALVSMLVAVALDHGCGALQRRGARRGLALTAVIFGLLATIVGVGLLLVPSLVDQAHALSQQAPQMMKKARESTVFQALRENLNAASNDDAPDGAQAQGGNKQELVQGTAKPVVKAVGGALSLVGALVTVLFLSIFMLIFGGRLVLKLLEETIPDRRDRYERVLQKIYSSVGGYIVGLLFICFCNALLTTLFLAFTHMPFFLPLGIMSGFSSLVPYAGPIVAGASITGLSFASGGVSKALLTGAYFVLYGQLEGNVLGPMVFRRTAHINPLMTMVSVLFFAELAGVAGAILAVPLMASAQIVIYELLAVRRERLNLPHPERPADPLSPEEPKNAPDLTGKTPPEDAADRKLDA